MKVQGKNIVVTGGGNGVGRELVLQLLNKGAMVVAVDINPEALDETVIIAGKNPKLFTEVVDISNKEAVFALAKNAIEKYGRIDGIIQPFVHLNELEMDRIERVMNINFYGTLYMVKAFLSHLLRRSEAHIVNVSSMGGYFYQSPGKAFTARFQSCSKTTDRRTVLRIKGYQC